MYKYTTIFDFSQENVIINKYGIIQNINFFRIGYTFGHFA